MSFSPASRLFDTRLEFTLSTVIVSIVFVGSTALAAERRSSPSRAPSWGTDYTSVVTLTAADFDSDDADEIRLASDVYLSCVNTPAALSRCNFLAGVPLPSGAVIEYVEFAVCDHDLAYEAVAHLYAFHEFSGGGAVVSVSTQSDAGCSFWTSEFVGLTVDNLSNIYVIRVELWEGSEARFRAVRVYYSLQVSPAPDSASFDDVPTDHAFFQYIEALYSSGITGGCGGGNFCPEAALTRGQMAVFLAKALGLHFPN